MFFNDIWSVKKFLFWEHKKIKILSEFCHSKLLFCLFFIFQVQNMLRKYFPDESILPMNALLPGLAAVRGAAIKAAAAAFGDRQLPKCLSRILLPNVAFHTIYGEEILHREYPRIVIHSGQQLTSKNTGIYISESDIIYWVNNWANQRDFSSSFGRGISKGTSPVLFRFPANNWNQNGRNVKRCRIMVWQNFWSFNIKSWNYD